MFHLERAQKLLWKWLFCSWAHRKWWGRKWPDEPPSKENHFIWHAGRCYPRVDLKKGEPGADFWHCTKCHPCTDDLVRIFKNPYK